MTPSSPAAADSREIRVFLSSTFRDFNEERRLLATQVFPELNRRARERGVELVEVDLRWGVTQAQAEDGHALEICLKEIERCKPYFIGMLGDSYGSLTPPQWQLLQVNPQLLEQRQWLEGRIGEASYTELEIEHSLQLLKDPAMAGRAFFYFRDPAYSDPRADAGEPGWRSDDPADRQKLELLRDKIRSSGYPLVERLASPKAIADQIKADLWALIDRQFPEGKQPDALEKEARKHADYRRSRTGAGQYIGGEGYIQQLEHWIEEGQQQILITGESGAGKSALIANWMERHAQSHPGDVVYAHHLGCTNDANALRPLLGRLIDTASLQLLEAEVISEPMKVPEDWWELVAKVAETLQSLGRWCQRQGRRWVWALDGLDRLDPDDQNALPWLPQTLPVGVQVLASALACPAREILNERGYTTLTIQPLEKTAQDQLIQRYLQRYTKELDGGLRQQILAHPLARSPLFLKVLLEELRQCGRHDTLKEQLGFYLSAQTVDDLYERVLERLENDGSKEAVKKLMTALWASRAGLTEPELLAITDLMPLQWAPIDLALEKAFGRNGNRLVFDHDYLRTAVEDRYLGSHKERDSCHMSMIKYIRDFNTRRSQERYKGLPENYDFASDPDNRFPAWEEQEDSLFGSSYADETEIFWHLAKASQWNELLCAFANTFALFSILQQLGYHKAAQIWHSIPGTTPEELGNLVNSGIEVALQFCNSPSSGPIKAAEICEHLAGFLDHMGVDSQRLRSIALDCITKPGIDYYDMSNLLDSTYKLGACHRRKRGWKTHLDLLIQALETYLSNNLRLPDSFRLLLYCELAVATCKAGSPNGIKIIEYVEEIWQKADNGELLNPDLLICCELLADAHESLGNNDKAIRILFKAHNLARQMHGEYSDQARRILLTIVSLHEKSGDTENGLSLSKNLLIKLLSLPKESTMGLLDAASSSARLAISAGKHDEARKVLENLFLRYATSFNQNPTGVLTGAASFLTDCLSSIELIVERVDTAESSNRFLFGGLGHFVWKSFLHIEDARIGDLATKQNYQEDAYDSEISRRRYLRWKIGIWTRLLGVTHSETVNARLEMLRFYCYCDKYEDAFRELVKILLLEADRRKHDSLSVFNAAMSWCKAQVLVFASDPQITQRLTACAHYLQNALDQISSNKIISPYKAHMKLLSLQSRSDEHSFLGRFQLDIDESRGLNWVDEILSSLITPMTLNDQSERERLSFGHGSIMGSTELEKLLDAYAMWIEASGDATSLKAGDQNSNEGERLLLAQVQRLLGPHHPLGLTAMVKLAKAYAKTGKTNIAEKYLSMSISSYNLFLESGSASALDALHELARLCIHLSRFDQAENILRSCLAVHEATGSNPKNRAEVIRDIADHLRLAEKSNDDKEIANRIQGLARESNDHILSVETQCTRAFGLFLLSIGKCSESFAALEEFFRMRRELYGANNSESMDVLASTLDVLAAQEMHREGIALSRDAQQALAVERGTNDPEILTQVFYQSSLYEELGEVEQAEDCYRQCLSGREAVLGSDHPNTLRVVYALAGVLSEQDRRAEAIPLRRRELTWCRQQNGDTDPGTLTSIHRLAIDLRETGELEEAEALFRELLAARQQVLEPSDFGIGRALGGLAKTLEQAGKLEEAAAYGQQALDHRLEHQGSDDFFTNHTRLDLSRILHKLGRSAEATQLLDALQASITSKPEPDDDDRQLLADAAALRAEIEANP